MKIKIYGGSGRHQDEETAIRLLSGSSTGTLELFIDQDNSREDALKGKLSNYATSPLDLMNFFIKLQESEFKHVKVSKCDPASSHLLISALPHNVESLTLPLNCIASFSSKDEEVKINLPALECLLAIHKNLKTLRLEGKISEVGSAREKTEFSLGNQNEFAELKKIINHYSLKGFDIPNVELNSESMTLVSQDMQKVTNMSSSAESYISPAAAAASSKITTGVEDKTCIIKFSNTSYSLPSSAETSHDVSDLLFLPPTVTPHQFIGFIKQYHDYELSKLGQDQAARQQVAEWCLKAKNVSEYLTNQEILKVITFLGSLPDSSPLILKNFIHPRTIIEFLSWAANVKVPVSDLHIISQMKFTDSHIIMDSKGKATALSNEKNILHHASGLKLDPKVIELILKIGVDIDSVVNRSKETSLFIAVKCHNDEAIKILLESGADTNKKVQEGFTPLMIAAQKGYPGIVKQLIIAGAKIEDLDATSNNALHIALNLNRVKIIKLLVEAGADVNYAPRKTLLEKIHQQIEKHPDASDAYKKIVEILLTSDHHSLHLNTDEDRKLVIDVFKSSPSLTPHHPPLYKDHSGSYEIDPEILQLIELNKHNSSKPAEDSAAAQVVEDQKSIPNKDDQKLQDAKDQSAEPSQAHAKAPEQPPTEIRQDQLDVLFSAIVTSKQGEDIPQTEPPLSKSEFTHVEQRVLEFFSGSSMPPHIEQSLDNMCIEAVGSAHHLG